MSIGFNSSVELKAGRTPMTRSGVWFKYITVRPIGLGEDDLVCPDQCFVAVASNERIVEHLEKIRICRDAVYLIILVVYHEVGRFNMDQACPLFYFRNGREQFRGSPGCHTDPISIADGIQLVRV